MHNENGNGFLELILALPIAILLFSLVVDCGLSLQEKGRLRDAMRTAIHSQTLVLRNKQGISEEVLQREMAEHLVKELRFRLLTRSSDLLNQDDLSVSVALLSLQFDPQSGQLRELELKENLANYQQGEPPNKAESRLIAEYLADFREREMSLSQSSYAVPLTPQLVSRTRRFLEGSTALIISTHAEAAGLPQNPFREFFPNISQIHEFSIVPLREQLG